METRFQYDAACPPQSLSNLGDVSRSPHRWTCLSFLPAGKTRGNARQSAEVPCEVALVGKPRGQRDLGQWQLRFAEQVFDMFEAALQQISVRRHSNGLSKRAGEMLCGKPCHGSESPEAYPFGEMRFKVFAYAVLERG